MNALLLALALIHAPADEQYEMVYDLYDADPRLADEVLDVADELGADTDELAIVIAIIADSTGDESRPWSSHTYDSTKNPVIGLMYDPVEPVKYHKGF